MAPQSFEEFWPYYVSQHRNKTCRQLHFVGTTIAMGCVAASPFVPAALIGAPLAGYGFAWIGHFAFEKNKPTILKHPTTPFIIAWAVIRGLAGGLLRLATPQRSRG